MRSTHGDAQMLLSQPESKLRVAFPIRLGQEEERARSQLWMGVRDEDPPVAAEADLVERVIVEQIGPMNVDQSAEGETVGPAPGKVTDVDLGPVAGRLALGPQEESILGRQAFFPME
jgi:hypothetical protein